MSNEPRDDWLREQETELVATGITPADRAWHALVRWVTEKGGTHLISPAEANRIISWFGDKDPSPLDRVGPMFVGSFFFERRCWPIFVPVIYGRRRVPLVDSLRTMPAETRARLAANHEASSTLVELWADCFDYGYGIDDLTDRQGSSSFFQQLLRSANSELCAGVSLLLQVRPNVKAADCFRMATEMIMKALLAREAALDDAGAKKYGHDLVALAVGCTSVKPLPQLVLVMPWIREFPEVGERYRGKEANGWDLWRLYTTAQLVAAMVVRSMTDRDTRSALYPSPTPTSS